MINDKGLVDRPQASDVIPNAPTDKQRIKRLPYRSASDPETFSTTAQPIVQEAMIPCMSRIDAPRVDSRVGRMTGTDDISSPNMRAARQTENNASELLTSLNMAISQSGAFLK
ncbi:hypothetical protein JCM15831A_19580 [Asaia astilbis]